jgi:hypothetical protein
MSTILACLSGVLLIVFYPGYCCCRLGKAGGWRKNTKKYLRKRRAKKLKLESACLLAAPNSAERCAPVSPPFVPVLPAPHEVCVELQDASAGAKNPVKSTPCMSTRVGGPVTTFRRTSHVPEGGTSNPPLRIIQRAALAAAVRRDTLLAMVVARAESSRTTSNTCTSPNSPITIPNRGNDPNQDE